MLTQIDSVTADGSDDIDIRVIACYREQSVHVDNPSIGRPMTFDTALCYDDRRSSIWPAEQILHQIMDEEWDHPHMRGGPEGNFNHDNYEISQCANLTPIPESPASPSLHEQGPNISGYNQAGLNVMRKNIVNSTLIYKGLSLEFQGNYGDCVVCGKSYEEIREIAALNFLESTAMSIETYNERQRRREAFMAGMETGTVLLVPGLSEAAACDGNYYQISADGNNTNLPRGVLPL